MENCPYPAQWCFRLTLEEHRDSPEIFKRPSIRCLFDNLPYRCVRPRLRMLATEPEYRHYAPTGWHICDHSAAASKVRFEGYVGSHQSYLNKLCYLRCLCAVGFVPRDGRASHLRVSNAQARLDRQYIISAAARYRFLRSHLCLTSLSTFRHPFAGSSV